MKITKTEFKSIIKECLQELVSEGALDHMVARVITERVAMQDPRVRAAAFQAAGGNLGQANIMEQVFADTMMNTLPQQQHAQNMLGNGMALPPGMQVGMMGEVVYSDPQQMMQQQPPQQQQYSVQGRNPLPPRDPHQTQQPQTASTWARLAFNSPISNRPGGARGGDPAHLPGSKKGSFE